MQYLFYIGLGFFVTATIYYAFEGDHIFSAIAAIDGAMLCLLAMYWERAHAED